MDFKTLLQEFLKEIVKTDPLERVNCIPEYERKANQVLANNLRSFRYCVKTEDKETALEILDSVITELETGKAPYELETVA